MGSSAKRTASYLFVLKRDDPAAGGSLLFGPSELACFEAENPGVLYPLSQVKEKRLMIKSDIPYPLRVGVGDNSLEANAATNEVEISYNDYSYFLLWLLEEGQLCFLSEILAWALGHLNKTAVNIRETTLRAMLNREKYSLRGKYERQILKVNDELDNTLGLFSIKAKSNSGTKTIAVSGPKNTKSECYAWMDRLRKIFFFHLRSGWFPSMNEGIVGGLGKKCMHTLFRKLDAQKDPPAFPNGTDGSLVCVADYRFGDNQKRVYFDPSSPFKLNYAMNRMSKNPDPAHPHQKSIGFEDTSTFFWLPVMDGEIAPTDPMINSFTKDKLDHDLRYQQLKTDLAGGSNTVGRFMPEDTKVITFTEYLQFVNTLIFCFHLTSVPKALFNDLYKRFMVPCKSYSAIDILEFLSAHGWKILVCNSDDTAKKKKINKVFKLHGKDMLTNSKKIIQVVVWVRVREITYNSEQYFQEEDATQRMIPSKENITLMEKLEKIKNFPKFELPERISRLVENKCREMMIDFDKFLPVVSKPAPASAAQKRQHKPKRNRNNNNNENDSSEEEDYDDDDDADDDEESIDNDDASSHGGEFEEEEEAEFDDKEKRQAGSSKSKQPESKSQGNNPGSAFNSESIQMLRVALNSNNDASNLKQKASSQASTALSNQSAQGSRPVPNPSSQSAQAVNPLHQAANPAVAFALSPLPPQLPSIHVNWPNLIRNNIMQHSHHPSQDDHAQAPHHNGQENSQWIAATIQKQTDYLSSIDFSAQISEDMIAFAKHAFAPQLYTPKISAILRRGKLSELQTRLFITAVMEQRLAEIRHLPSLLQPDGDQDDFSEAVSKDIKEDVKKFVELFVSTWMPEEHLDAEESTLLGRCYCAHWIFGRQLVRDNQFAFYLQLYESEHWIPILFLSNIAHIENHKVIFKTKEMNLGEALTPKQDRNDNWNLVLKIPEISEYLGNETGPRSSRRRQTKKMKLPEFLDSFFTKYGSTASVKLQCSYNANGYPADISKAFYPCTFQVVQNEASCLSDLLYLAALHQLRRGFPIHDCQEGRKQMLRHFLLKVCRLNQGMVDFLENLVQKHKQIHRGYIWLMIVFLKHNHFAGDDLQASTFNDINRIVDTHDYLKELLAYDHKSATFERGQTMQDGDCEYLWETKGEIERKLMCILNKQEKRDGAERDREIFKI